jgi:tRNA(fMet)-specific endonuclease VapC
MLRKQGAPLPTNDIWIAAVALETGSRLVAYDDHFDCIPGLIVIAP